MSKPKYDNEDYKYFVYYSKSKKIISGWEYKSDAKDHLKELNTSYLKVYSRTYLNRIGKKPSINKNWGSDRLSGVKYPKGEDRMLYGLPKQIQIPEIRLRYNKGKTFGKINSSDSAYQFLKKVYGREIGIQEQIIMLFMDNSNNILGYYKHTVGTPVSAMADIPMLMGIALKSLSRSFILSHNHPSGNKNPSEADNKLTKRLNEAAKLLNLNLLDHIICTKDKGYYSYADFGNNSLGRVQKALDLNEVEKEDKIKVKNIERISEEVKFIKRYSLLDGKTKTKSQILLFINSLQRAITEKRIRKTSEYAEEIRQIQSQLVKMYGKMPATKKVKIEKKILEKYKAIAHSEKTMPSISYIKQYFSLHGKKNVEVKAKALMKKLLKAVDDRRLHPKDPYRDQLERVYKSLLEYTKGITKTPLISQAELNGLRGLVDTKQSISKKKEPTVKVDLSGPSQVISSVQLSEMQFDTIGLKGKYKDLIGDPSVGFSCMVYGKPKSGKSTMSIDFARHLAENHGKVLYAAIEEGYGYTMKEKLERLNAVHKNLFVSEQIPDDFSSFDFVFIDSVSKGKVDNEKLNELIKAHPKTAFVFIFHSTKSGDFRGGQENAHDVDCLIEVADGVAVGKGRFGVGGEMEVFG